MEEKYYLQDVLDGKIFNLVAIDCGTPEVTTALAHLLSAFICPSNPQFYNCDDNAKFLILSKSVLSKETCSSPDSIQTTPDKFIMYTTDEGKEVTLQDMLSLSNIKEQILQHTKHKHDFEKEQVEAEIKRHEKTIQDILDVIEKHKDQIKKFQNKLIELDEENFHCIDPICSEIEDIKNNENCESVTFLNNYIYARTKDLYITEPTTSRKFYLGKMFFQIPLDTSNDIYIWNLTKQRVAYSGNMQHPHIFSDGKACFGNTDSMLSQFLNNQQYNAVFCTLLSFCQTANIDDEAGVRLAEWPEVAADGTLFQGEEFENNETFICPCCHEECDNDDGYYCEDCGETVCPNCVVYIDNEDKYVCSDCYNEQYTQCNKCGENFRQIHIDIIDGEYICEDCIEDLIENDDIAECQVCGSFHYTNRMLRYCNDRDEIIYCCAECEAPEGYTLV